MTTSSATSDENVVKMMTFSFPYTNLHQAGHIVLTTKWNKLHLHIFLEYIHKYYDIIINQIFLFSCPP